MKGRPNIKCYTGHRTFYIRLVSKLLCSYIVYCECDLVWY